MTSHPGVHATAITIETGHVVTRELRARALPLLALVDASGAEQDPLTILEPTTSGQPVTTAYKVIDVSGLAQPRPTILVVHEGPGTAERAQGYTDIISDLWGSSGDPFDLTIRFDEQELTFSLGQPRELRERALVRWAREGLNARPAHQYLSALVLLPSPAPNSRSSDQPSSDAGALLRRGIVGFGHSGTIPYTIPASTASDQLTVLQHMPHLLNGQDTRLISTDTSDGVGLIEAPAYPGKTLPTAHMPTWSEATAVTSLSAPTGIGGPIAHRIAPNPDTPHHHRQGAQGRLIYLDSSALIADIDRQWFHPDDEVFTCEITAFHAAGSIRYTQEPDYERKTWSVVSHGYLKPIPVSTNMIYDYGARILHMREKKLTFHPDASRYEVWATVVANYYGAVLATCLPERYKDLMPGLEIAHYQPLGNGWASRLGWNI